MSVVTPPSHCPSCGEPVKAINNVPIFGWLWLRGRAACCNAKLTPRYPLVELMSALLCVALAERFLVRAEHDVTALDGSLLTLVYFAFVGGLVVAAFVDLEWMEIPDEVSLPGAALGLLTATFRPDPGVADAALGAGAGYLAVQIVFVIVRMGVDREALRGLGTEQGDVLGVLAHGLGLARAAHVLVDAHDAIGGGHDEMQVVGDHQNPAVPRGADLGDQAVELELTAHVDARDGLIQNEGIRIPQERAREQDALELPARKRLHGLVHDMRRAHFS